jgi:hypothetical protein
MATFFNKDGQNYKIASLRQNYIEKELRMFYYFQFFLTFASEARGFSSSRPGSYREARVCDGFLNCSFYGGLAQLARACGWQPQGQGFDSPNLHKHTLKLIQNPVSFILAGFFLLMIC